MESKRKIEIITGDKTTIINKIGQPILNLNI